MTEAMSDSFTSLLMCGQFAATKLMIATTMSNSISEKPFCFFMKSP